MHLRKKWLWLILACAALLLAGAGYAVIAARPPKLELDFDPAALKNVSVEVYKQERRLDLLADGVLVDSYKIGLGGSPEGHKQREGDQKTPEGEYYICTRNQKSRYYLSLGLSYPNGSDAKAGLDAGVITQKQYNEIETAINEKKQPDWNTALGGAIMIHGRGSGSDWTLGCIAVDDAVMDVLWACCGLKTPVTVYP